MSLLRPDSYKKGVIKSTLFNILAKGLGFINSLIIIYLFGSGSKTDLYFVILSTGTVITSFINSIDSLVLIPESMRLRQKSGEEAERHFLNFFVWVYAGIGIILFSIVFFFPSFYYSLFSKYDQTFLDSEGLLLRMSALLPPIQLVSNLFITIMASYRYFTTPMIVGLINSTISIITLGFIQERYSIAGALAALIAGNLVNLIWIIYHFHSKLGWRFFQKSPFPPRRVFGNIFMMQLNVLPISIRTLSTVYFLSGIGAGVITSLNYGQQLALIPELFLITQILTVVGIKFNELSAKGDGQQLNIFFQKIQRMLLFIAMPVGIYVALSSDEIITLLFSYSSKFDKGTASNMALVLTFVALTLPARALDLSLTRLVMSQQRIKQGVAYGVFTHIGITLLVIIGVLSYGLKGYLTAMLMGYCLLLPCVYYFLLKRIAPFIEYKRWFKESLPFIACNLAVYGLMLLFKRSVLGGVNALLVISLIGVIYAAVGLFINVKLLNYVPLDNLLRKLKIVK